jgi:hypothetical protein
MPKRTFEFWGVDIEAQRGATWGDWASKLWFGAAWGPEGDVQYTAPDDEQGFLDLFYDMGIPGRIWVAHNALYDLNGINDHAQKLGHGPLPDLDYVDTCSTYHRSDFFGKKLADQAHHYRISQKGSVDRYVWEAAYMGEPWALKLVREYNMNDVDVVLQLRKCKLEDGTLRPVRRWRADGKQGR